MSEMGRPDVNALVMCGTRLARLLSLPVAPERILRLKIEEVLFERQNYSAFKEGIITRTEIRNVLLAHMQTLICHVAGVEEPSKGWDDPKLYCDVEEAICGRG
jgi:hypothetical protein